MRSPTSRPFLLAAALLLVSDPIVAQQLQHSQDTAAGHQMMGKMDMSADCPMMSAMMLGPGAALGSSGALHLSAGQVSQLQALKHTLDQGRKAGMDSMMALHRQINGIVQASQFDEPAARAAFDRMGALHADMGLTMARAQHQVAGILTPAQEKSLAAIGKTKMNSNGMSGMSGMCSDS
jgi:Spy/CpxP family protein refolding chaperone